jgi:hypothetical protein
MHLIDGTELYSSIFTPGLKQRIGAGFGYRSISVIDDFFLRRLPALCAGPLAINGCKDNTGLFFLDRVVSSFVSGQFQCSLPCTLRLFMQKI